MTLRAVSARPNGKAYDAGPVPVLDALAFGDEVVVKGRV